MTDFGGECGDKAKFVILAITVDFWSVKPSDQRSVVLIVGVGVGEVLYSCF